MQALLREVRTNPYAHVLLHMLTDAWADGYRQACRDLDVVPADDHTVLCDRAAAHMLERERSARAALAMAQLAQDLGPLALPRLDGSG